LGEGKRVAQFVQGLPEGRLERTINRKQTKAVP